MLQANTEKTFEYEIFSFTILTILLQVLGNAYSAQWKNLQALYIAYVKPNKQSHINIGLETINWW